MTEPEAVCRLCFLSILPQVCMAALEFQDMEFDSTLLSSMELYSTMHSADTIRDPFAR